jgi:hypothetical protein
MPVTTHRHHPILRLVDDGLDWRAVEGEVLALDLGSAEYLSVNRSGAVLWSALASGISRDELVARLMERFGIDAARAQADVGQFLDQLQARGLLTEGPGGPIPAAG